MIDPVSYLIDRLLVCSGMMRCGMDTTSSDINTLLKDIGTMQNRMDTM